MPWRWSTAAIALAVAALLGVIVAITLSGLGPPAQSLEVRAIQCQHFLRSGAPLDAEHPVQLPYLATGRMNRPDVVMICHVAIDLPADEAQNAGLLTPEFADAISITLNGQRIALSELFVMRNMQVMSLPAFAALPPDLARAGPNDVQITLSARPNRTASLGPIFVGPRPALQSNFRERWFVAAVFPTLVIGGEVALALVFGLIWIARRRETEFGWLAVFLVLGAAHGSVLLPDFSPPEADYPISNMFVLWEVTAVLMFMRAIAGAPNTRRTWLLAVPPLLLWALRLLGPTSLIGPVITPIGLVVFIGYLGLGVWTLARAAMRGNRDAAVILLGMVVVLVFAVHDVLILGGVVRSQSFMARGAVSALMVVICTLTTLRFLRAMGALDHAAEAYRLRADTAEAELRSTYEELRIRREAEAIERERGRLMRDLHDGVGGELASMLALADSPEPRSAEIAHHARAALADMRLIISSLEDYGGDLALALGAWRERAEPQVRAAGLKLDWRVRNLPTLPGLGPAQVLDILRIVQEGVTNVIKHAQATRLTVAAYEAEGAVVIAVRDDGVGLQGSGAGNGLRNMATRAERLGAVLELRQNGDATELVLVLPRRP